MDRCRTQEEKVPRLKDNRLADDHQCLAITEICEHGPAVNVYYDFSVLFSHKDVMLKDLSPGVVRSQDQRVSEWYQLAANLKGKLLVGGGRCCFGLHQEILRGVLGTN